MIPVLVPPSSWRRHVDRKRKSQRRRVPAIRREAGPFFDVVLRFENDLLIAVETCRALAPDDRTSPVFGRLRRQDVAVSALMW